ncbi:MAG TPA: hypothetical protein VFC19_30250 [Candidatus Limnocylindrales bacterium]|nr:hypothetical protein [Candidatus Limnocylindrales bacterium]
MDVAALEQALDEMFDQALVYHGYTDCMRDYEVIVYVTADPNTGIAPGHRRYLFRYCVLASCQTALTPDIWRSSLDERLIDYSTGVDLDGHVWGVKWQPLYPGASVVTMSATTDKWERELGIEFHEVRIQANAHDLTLVFSNVDISDVPMRYVPFRVTDDA